MTVSRFFDYLFCLTYYCFNVFRHSHVMGKIYTRFNVSNYCSIIWLNFNFTLTRSDHFPYNCIYLCLKHRNIPTRMLLLTEISYLNKYFRVWKVSATHLCSTLIGNYHLRICQYRISIHHLILYKKKKNFISHAKT